MSNEDQILAVLNQILATQQEALANQRKAIAAQELAIARQASHLRLYKFALVGVALLVASLVYVLLKLAGPYWSATGGIS